MRLKHKKNIIIKALSFVFVFILASLILPNYAIAANETNTPVTVYISGTSSTVTTAVLIENTTYVPLREFCLVMDEAAEVIWDERMQTAIINTDGLNISVTVGDKYLVANGRYLYLEKPCYISEGITMAPVRALARAFNAEVSWNSELCRAIILRGDGTIESGDTWYNEEDLYWLSRIISAEAKGESLEGQIAVGNVVINRLNSDEWPDTIKEVIFDKKCGVQFSPTANGAIYNEPAKISVIAAKLVLDGAQVAGGSLYFLNEAKATSRWITNNCDYVTTIGSHSFYM
jgi:N-acetylmuramoyl-L-alanine amidase